MIYSALSSVMVFDCTALDIAFAGNKESVLLFMTNGNDLPFCELSVDEDSSDLSSFSSFLLCSTYDDLDLCADSLPDTYDEPRWLVLPGTPDVVVDE